MSKAKRTIYIEYEYGAEGMVQAVLMRPKKRTRLFKIPRKMYFAIRDFGGKKDE